MDLIKLQKFDNSDDCFFLDAGDITIEPITEWYSIIVKRKDGLPLFEMGMHPDYVAAFGSVSGYLRNIESFDIPVGLRVEKSLRKEFYFDIHGVAHQIEYYKIGGHDVFCFDPRVVSSVIFMGGLRSKVFKYKEKIRDITLPVLSFEEAKDFLKRNNLLCENPNSEWRPNPPKKLIGIPEKVQALFE